MQSTFRPYATVGVAIVGAGLIAVTPVSAPVPEAATVHDVVLAAGDGMLGDFLAPWAVQFNTAADNASVLANNFYLAPGVASQQFLANQADFWQQLLNDPLNSNDVSEQLHENLKSVLSSLTLLNADADTVTTAQSLGLSSIHDVLFGSFPGFLPPDLAEAVTPILNFLSSPLSGILIGALGPWLSPAVGLINSISDGDSFSEILANTVGAFFNGATLDLDALVPLVNAAGLLPEGTSITELSLALGGLFSPGDVLHQPWQLYDSSGNSIAEVPAVGGSMFNSLGIELAGVPGVGDIGAAGAGVGPLAAWQSLSELIGIELGSGWDGHGNDAIPPGGLIDFPTIPIDSDDGGSASAAVDVANVLHDLFG